MLFASDDLAAALINAKQRLNSKPFPIRDKEKKKIEQNSIIETHSNTFLFLKAVSRKNLISKVGLTEI